MEKRFNRIGEILTEKGIISKDELESILKLQSKLKSAELRNRISGAIKDAFDQFIEEQEETQNFDKEEIKEHAESILEKNANNYLEELKKDFRVGEIAAMLTNGEGKEEKREKIEKAYREKIEKALEDFIENFSEVNFRQLIDEGKCSIKVNSPFNVDIANNQINGHFMILGVSERISFEFTIKQDPFSIEIGTKSAKVMQQIINNMLKKNFGKAKGKKFTQETPI